MKKSLIASAVLLAFTQLASASIGIQATDRPVTDNVELTGTYIVGMNVTGVHASFQGESISIKGPNNGVQVFTKNETPSTSLQLGKKGVTELISIVAKDTDWATGLKNLAVAKAENTPAKGAVVDVNTEVLVVSSTATDSDGYAYGINVANGSTVAIEQGLPRATINIKANDTYVDVNAPNSNYANALVAMSEGVLNIDGNLYVNTQGGKGNAILARGDAIVNINASNTHTVVLNGNVDFNFDKATSKTPVNTTVNINLTGKNSSWTGNTVVSWDDASTEADETLTVSKMTLSLTDGATWTPVETKNDATNVADGRRYVPLNYLKLKDGNVNVTDEKINVTVENLEGKGTINLAVVQGEKELTSGSFTVLQEKDANLNVQLTNITSDDITAKEAAALMNDAVTGVKNTAGSVDEGMYNGAFTFDNQGQVTSQATNTIMQSTLELASASTLSLNRILMNDVRKRLGDIRSAEAVNGVWARYDGGRLSGDGTKNKFNTIHIGGDTMPFAGTPVRVGMSASYTNGDVDYTRGNADMDAYSLAAYGTWLGDNGMFADVIARVAKAESDMTVDSVYKGKLKNTAYSLSGEFGWRFDLNSQFYAEPQVEATYTYIDSDKMTLAGKNETFNYEVEGFDSFIGRMGVLAGMKCPNQKGDVYVRASLVHEFLGDAKINGGANATLENEGKDTWFEYGIGANFNVGKNTYLWADLERTSGALVDEDIRGTLGVRYGF